jgi:GntR family transcriptional repressor for pyruvate dehydrogenase complex
MLGGGLSVGQTKFRDRKLYVRIAGAIRSAIEQGIYVMGDKLPTLADLAIEFGCSRATVREALSALRGQGLVEFRHGDGTYVRTATVDMWMEPLDAALLLSVNQVMQVADLQTAVLSGIASLAANRIEEAGLSDLSQALFRLECAVPDAEEAIAAELAFYLTLSEYGENPLMANVVRVMQEAFRSVLRVTNQTDPLGLRVCRDLFDAIQARNPVQAREIVYQYGDEVVRRLRLTRVAAAP